MSPTRKVLGLVVVLVASAALGGLIWDRSFSAWARPEQVEVPPGAPVSLHPVQIRPGPETPSVRSGAFTHAGTPGLVACSTCHSTRAPSTATQDAAQLREFHQGLQYTHGGLSCLSCHNAENYDTLRRADGTPIAFPNTVQLCAQCHGPQHRDYQNGSHGGMTGFWDLRQGPRQRNTCSDCHDPHAPAYQRVMPIFPPQDRGARQQQQRGHGGTAHE